MEVLVLILGVIVCLAGWFLLLFGVGVEDFVNIHLINIARAVIDLGYFLLITGLLLKLLARLQVKSQQGREQTIEVASHVEAVKDGAELRSLPTRHISGRAGTFKIYLNEDGTVLMETFGRMRTFESVAAAEAYIA
jgi:hypothetical protein